MRPIGHMLLMSTSGLLPTEGTLNACKKQQERIGFSQECEKKFGDRRAEFEEPCKLAVSSHFSEADADLGGLRVSFFVSSRVSLCQEGCFPPFAKVRERQLGELLISQVEAGPEPVFCTSRQLLFLLRSVMSYRNVRVAGRK